ncbi:uncharacterized protein PF3D7_1120000-like [Procambarus clarkii]|uniref:uncharacterized protein PF3D7_1120000-like n=1 Tax=Procambarus clarkii TaxID=6728 RepID=UPI0037437088
MAVLERQKASVSVQAEGKSRLNLLKEIIVTEIIEDLLKNYEEKVIELEQENEALRIEVRNLKGSILQQEEVNKDQEKYKEEIKETYAQVVKEKETIKEVRLEVKTRNDQQEAEMKQAVRKQLFSGNMRTSREHDECQENVTVSPEHEGDMKKPRDHKSGMKT